MNEHYKKIGFWLSLLTIISAFGVHVYLTVLHFKLKLGMGTVDSVCNVSSRFNCESALASPYSEFLGSPLSVWALSLHTLLLAFFLSYKFPVLGLGSQVTARYLSRAISWLIFGGSVFMLVLSLVAMTVYCPMCITLYVLSLFTLIFIHLATKEEAPTPSKLNDHAKWISYSLIFFAVTSLLGGRILLQQYGGQELQRYVNDAVLEWREAREQLSPRAEGAHIGPEDAIMEITEFADFLCIHCKNAAQRLHAFYSSRSDVRFVFQSFPLDGECNPEIPRAMGLSCRLSYIAQCGFDQTQDLSVHSWIFSQQENFRSPESTEALIKQMISELKLDGEALSSCEKSEETQEKVRAQARMGRDWGVQGTPSIYVNGKKLPGGQMLPVLESVHNHLRSQK